MHIDSLFSRRNNFSIPLSMYRPTYLIMWRVQTHSGDSLPGPTFRLHWQSYVIIRATSHSLEQQARANRGKLVSKKTVACRMSGAAWTDPRRRTNALPVTRSG